jgi:branched-chain amino acid transport system ATP-binding protein
MATLRRSASYVFQHNALFDSATVFENVLLPLQARGTGTRPEWGAQVREVLGRLELEEAADRYPSELSGGMQKRLAVARALVTRPELVFFDEPTAGMSADEAPVILDLIRKLKADKTKTILLVEHKMDVVRELADRIIVLHNGQLVADGEPSTVIALPVVQEAYLGIAPNTVPPELVEGSA